MRDRFNSRSAVTLLSCALLASSCGVFESFTSEGSSESSSNSSSSISKSFSPEEEEKSAYQRDIRDFTAQYVRSHGDSSRLQSDLARLAEQYGITDWEQDPGTHVAIGRGVARAGLGQSEMQQLAAAITSGNDERAGWVRYGYEHARR